MLLRWTHLPVLPQETVTSITIVSYDAENNGPKPQLLYNTERKREQEGVNIADFLVDRGSMMGTRTNVTALLAELADGNTDATTKLLPLVYDELRELADKY